MVRALCFVVSLAALLGACGETAEPAPAPAPDTLAACQKIATECHVFDKGSGVAHDCHELGHNATTDAPCVAKQAECLAVCVDAGTAVTTDAASDAATD